MAVPIAAGNFRKDGQEMIYRLIDRLTDKFYNFDPEKDRERAILTGGWLILFACILLLFDDELLLGALGLALVGAGFAITGIFYAKKK